VFTLLATFIASNIAIFAANTYYNLDTGEIVVNEIQRVTDAIRATGGLIVGGTAGQDPTGIFEVAGTGNITFSTSGTITQTGTGAVQFGGDVGIGGPASNYEFEVTDGDANSIVAQFHGRVIGAAAVNDTEFVTLGQLTDGGGGGGLLNAFVQGGNAFGTAAILGTTDAQDVQFIAGGGAAKFTLFDNDPDVVAAFSGRVRGVDAVEDNELVTLAQLNSIVAGSLTFEDNGFGFASYSSGTLALHEIDIIADTDLAAGPGLAFTGSSLGVDGVLEDLDTLGPAGSDGQFIVATGAGTFAYESGATARASLGLTIGSDVQAFDAGLAQIAGLADPNADRIMFWDDSAGSYAYLETTTGLNLSGTTLSVVSASETVAGIAEFATLGEVNAGASTTTTVTPATLAGWTGSGNIATVGTITSGVWNGTAIADAYIASSADWNAAFSWGNHALAGYFDMDDHDIGDIPGIALDTTIADNEVLAYNSGTQEWINQTPSEAGLATVADLHAPVTLAGQNYLSLSGQQITANAINLGTTNVTGTLPVNRGGTGATSLTSGGVLFGGGTGAITASAVLTNGQLLIGDGTGAPTAATLTEGTGITITNGAGSITISADTGDLDGSYFAQGGNSFGAPAVLGTNDANSLSFETNGVTRATISAVGGLTLADGNGFTVTNADSSFGGDINLTGGARTISATAGILTLASTSNIQFFDASNYITSGGDLFIAGDFTLSGLTITDNGTLTTIASTDGNQLVLDSDTGSISVGDNALVTDQGYDLTSGTIFREVQPIFGFDVPIRCSTSCDTEAARISRTLETYSFPSAYAGTTRNHNFTIHYADSFSAGSSTWSVVEDGGAVITTFTVPASPSDDLDASTVYTTPNVAIPTDGTDWYLAVTVGNGNTIQVNQVFLGAYDVIQ
jgi:hypothetical protein